MKELLREYKANIFRALAHPARVGIVEHLRFGELSVAELCERLSLEQANASQHLAVLRAIHIVQTRKAGNQTFYRLRHETMGQLLDLLRAFFAENLEEALGVLRDAQVEDVAERKSA
jgi:DNA-binding transcriptional ArsR family regulator